MHALFSCGSVTFGRQSRKSNSAITHKNYCIQNIYNKNWVLFPENREDYNFKQNIFSGT